MTPTARPLGISKSLLAAGALAGAIGSVLALGATVTGWFEPETPGSVTSLRIQSIRPLTYGEWSDHEGASTKGLPRAELAVTGKLVIYELTTRGYRDTDILAVRMIVHDVTHHTSKAIRVDPVRVRHGDTCGCFDWVPVPSGRSRYYLEVAIFPPGPIRGQPLKTVSSRYYGPTRV